MTKWMKYIFAFVILAFALACCITPYEPPTVTHNQQYLVVDAFLDTKDDSAFVTLQRSTPLDSHEAGIPETTAVVSIYDENGNIIRLDHKGNGIYSISTADFSNEKRYKLTITSLGKLYESDFVVPLVSPEIDSITLQPETERLVLEVNTHDPSGKSRYYRWFLTETFEYRTGYFSGYNFLDGQVIAKVPGEYIDRCWRTNTIHDINIRSTESLAEDRVSHLAVHSIPRNDLRLSLKYSLHVKQQRLTEEAYHYWVNVKQTTENLGGLFDPVPSQVIGNIHCVDDPSEPVIGFFSAGSFSEERIYFTYRDLPTGYSTFRQYCELDTILIKDLKPGIGKDVLLHAVYEQLTIIGYATTSTECYDCRFLGGGTTRKPDFWE